MPSHTAREKRKWMYAEQLLSASTCVQIYNCKSLKIVIIAVKKIKQDITRENNSVG